MENETLDDMIQLLHQTGKFKTLLDNYSRDTQDRSFWFEIAFAYWMENYGYCVDYEVNANPENDKTIDFKLIINSYLVYFELLRVENSNEINKHIMKQQNIDHDFHSYELVLNSNSKNPKFTTAAQLIRLQEKLLEKTNKFPLPSNQSFSVIACDCSNIHQGLIDDEDIRMAMFGKSNNHVFQEYWEEEKLKGMFENKYNYRHSDCFKNRIHAVIFVPNLKPNGLNESMVTINPALVNNDLNMDILLNTLKSIKPFENITLVE